MISYQQLVAQIMQDIKRVDVDMQAMAPLSRDSVLFPVGEKVFIRQECTEDIPEVFSNETILFPGIYMRGERYNSVVFFEDTIVRRVMYQYNEKDITPALALFGLSKQQFSRKIWKTYVYNAEKGNIQIICRYNKKRFIYEEKLIQN